MRTEKIIKREDGSRVRISATPRIGFFDITYKIRVELCDAGKRTWRHTCYSDSYLFRRLNMEQREEAIYKSYLEHVTEDEIHQARLEAWKSLKPKPVI